MRKRIPQTATPNGRRCSPRGETLRQHATRIQKETLPASIGLRFLPRTGYSRSRFMRKRFLKRETLRLTVTRIHLETAIHAADYPNACLQFVVAFALFSCFYLFFFVFMDYILTHSIQLVYLSLTHISLVSVVTLSQSQYKSILLPYTASPRVLCQSRKSVIFGFIIKA